MIKQLFHLTLSACGAVILVAACQASALEEEIVLPVEQEQPVVSELVTIPYSIAVNTESTRVSYEGGQYAFKTGDSGDKLHVVGVERTDLGGYLSTNDGTNWSGELTYDPSKGELGNPKLSITLVHAGNEDESTYAFGLVGGVKDENDALLREAVEKYSLFTNVDEVTFSDHAATLYQQAAFLDVTVTFDFDGTREVEAGQALVDLKIGQHETTIDTDFFELDNKEDFEVHFMAVVPGGESTETFFLSVGDRTIFDNKPTILCNRKYRVSRTVDYHPQLGDPFWSDGLYGRMRHPDQNATIVGIIVYVNKNGSDIEKAVTEKDAGFGHGLVMSLRNAAVYVPWSSSNEDGSFVGCTGQDHYITKPNQTTALGNLSGYTNTNSIINALNESVNNELDGNSSAALRAKKYSVDVSPEYTTGWFLPSIGQWIYTISTEGFGGALPNSQWLNGNHVSWNNLNDLIYVMENEGNVNNSLVQYLNNRLQQLKDEFGVDYDEFGMWNKKKFADNYWSSSEGSASTAIRMNFGSVEPYNDKYWATIKVKPEPKDATSA